MKVHYDRNGNPEFWTIGEYTFGGKEVSKSDLLYKGYCQNAYMAMLSDAIGEKSASLPKVFCNAEGDEIPKDDPRVAPMLELMNKGESIEEKLKKSTTTLVALGEFFVIMEEAVGFSQTKNLFMVSPASTTPNTQSGQPWDVRIKDFTVTEYYQNTILPEDMIWGKLPNINSSTIRGLSPFESSWDAVLASTNALQAHGQLVRNMGANGIISPKGSDSVETLPMVGDDRDWLQRTIDKVMTSFGGGKSRKPTNFGKTIVFNKAVDFTQLGMDPQKLEILRLSESSLKVLCSAVKLDSKLFNDSQGSTFNNQDTVEKRAYLDCYIPYTNFVLEVYAKALLPEGIYWKVDKEKIDKLNERNQAREKETREGIVQVQNQVADGKITVSAGVATLATVYEFSEEKALALLDVQALNISLPEGSESGQELEEAGEESASRFGEFGVGGVQGILDIQASVASGITQYDAGINILVLIYGLSEQEARQILGNEQELEQAQPNETIIVDENG